MKILKLTIPKGSLEKNTYKLFAEAGLDLGSPGRSYRPKTSDPELEIKILRPQEIPTMISQGAHDIGISGVDWRDEANADIIDLLDLEYGGIKLVLAIPEAWKDVNSLDDFQASMSSKRSIVPMEPSNHEQETRNQSTRFTPTKQFSSLFPNPNLPLSGPLVTLLKLLWRQRLERFEDALRRAAVAADHFKYLTGQPVARHDAG